MAKKKKRRGKQKPSDSGASKARLKKIASFGTAKAKDAAKFVYDNRDKIKEALELVVMVVGTASQVFGKPAKRPRRRRK